MGVSDATSAFWLCNVRWCIYSLYLFAYTQCGDICASGKNQKVCCICGNPNWRYLHCRLLPCSWATGCWLQTVLEIFFRTPCSCSHSLRSSTWHPEAWRAGTKGRMRGWSPCYSPWTGFSCRGLFLHNEACSSHCYFMTLPLWVRWLAQGGHTTCITLIKISAAPGNWELNLSHRLSTWSTCPSHRDESAEAKEWRQVEFSHVWQERKRTDMQIVQGLLKPRPKLFPARLTSSFMGDPGVMLRALGTTFRKQLVSS